MKTTSGRGSAEANDDGRRTDEMLTSHASGVPEAPRGTQMSAGRRPFGMSGTGNNWTSATRVRRARRKKKAWLLHLRSRRLCDFGKERPVSRSDRLVVHISTLGGDGPEHGLSVREEAPAVQVGGSNTTQMRAQSSGRPIRRRRSQRWVGTTNGPPELIAFQEME